DSVPETPRGDLQAPPRDRQLAVCGCRLHWSPSAYRDHAGSRTRRPDSCPRDRARIPVPSRRSAGQSGDGRAAIRLGTRFPLGARSRGGFDGRCQYFVSRFLLPKALQHAAEAILDQAELEMASINLGLDICTQDPFGRPMWLQSRPTFPVTSIEVVL